MSLMAEGDYYGQPERGEMMFDMKGQKYMYLHFTVTHVLDSTNNWKDCPAGIKRATRLYYTPNALPSTDKKLRAMGFNGDFGNPVFKNALAFTCEHNGEYENWGVRWPLEGGTENDKALSESDVLQLNADWDARHNKPAVPSGAPASPSKAPPAADGIPF